MPWRQCGLAKHGPGRKSSPALSATAKRVLWNEHSPLPPRHGVDTEFQGPWNHRMVSRVHGNHVQYPQTELPPPPQPPPPEKHGKTLAVGPTFCIHIYIYILSTLPIPACLLTPPGRDQQTPPSACRRKGRAVEIPQLRSPLSRLGGQTPLELMASSSQARITEAFCGRILVPLGSRGTPKRGGFPYYKIDYKKQDTLVLSSLLEDLG